MILLLLTIAALPCVYVWPPTSSIVFGCLFSFLMWSVYFTNKSVADDGYNILRDQGFSSGEADVMLKYSYYMQNPLSSKIFSSGATFVQLFCVLWIGYLCYQNLWVYCLIPIYLYFFSRIMRRVCDPGLHLSAKLGILQHKDPMGFNDETLAITKELLDLESAYFKVWDRSI